jgi:superfamily II helicase
MIIYWCKICGQEKEITLEDFNKVTELKNLNVCEECKKEKIK